MNKKSIIFYSIVVIGVCGILGYEIFKPTERELARRTAIENRNAELAKALEDSKDVNEHNEGLNKDGEESQGHTGSKDMDEELADLLGKEDAQPSPSPSPSLQAVANPVSLISQPTSQATPRKAARPQPTPRSSNPRSERKSSRSEPRSNSSGGGGSRGSSGSGGGSLGSGSGASGGASPSGNLGGNGGETLAENAALSSTNAVALPTPEATPAPNQKLIDLLAGMTESERKNPNAVDPNSGLHWKRDDGTFKLGDPNYRVPPGEWVLPPVPDETPEETE